MDGSLPATSGSSCPTDDCTWPDGRGDLIITGGENVWPEAVEAAIADHPGVADVLVRGVDDPEWGQLVEAVIVPVGDPPTLDSIREHVKQHHPSFMAPKRLAFVEALPRTSLGKLRRHLS